MRNGALPMNTNRGNAWFVLAGMTLLYVGVYLVLSVQGNYAPAYWGISGVKEYGWSPRFFTSGPAGTVWHKIPMRVFFPLHVIDERFWHTSGKAFDGYYPVNKALENAFEERDKRQQQKQPVPPAPTRDATEGD